MNGMISVFRRELASYFITPIGYIYLVAFLWVCHFLGLFATVFFLFPTADMRGYFYILGGVSTILLSAMTMRLWAEEREENTFEMLLTLPVQTPLLVLGKFMASLAFFALALCCTLTVPLMMVLLSRGQTLGGGAFGLLDIGPVLSGYLGALLLGAFFIAFGQFVSGICRSQVVAFVVTAPLLFVVYAVGLPDFQPMVNSMLSFISEKSGEYLADFFGVFPHYKSLARGTIDVGDLLFFLIWTVVFLILNVLSLDRRGRKDGTLMLAVASALLIGIGLAANMLIMDKSLGQWDVTEDKIFTISDESGEILANLDDVVTVKYYVSSKDKLPPSYRILERSVREKLEALKRAAGENLRIVVVGNLDPSKVLTSEFENMGKEEKKDREKSLEEQLLKKVKPFTITDSAGDSFNAQLVYSAIEILYRDKESEVIPQVNPGLLPKLEYQIVRRVYEMTRKTRPVVALIAPRMPPGVDPRMAAFMRMQGQQMPDPYGKLQGYLREDGWEVKRADLTEKEPLPAELEALVLINPQHLDDRQQYEIARAISAGTPAFIAVQLYEWNYRVISGGINVTRRDIEPRINPILKPWGVAVSEKVLMDKDSVPLQMGGIEGLVATGGQPFTFPMQVKISTGSINQEHVLTKGLEDCIYIWGTPIELDDGKLDENGLSSTVLMQSSPQSWTRQTVMTLSQTDIESPAETARDATGKLQLRPRPLMVLLEGKFPFAFKDMQTLPKWAPAPDPMGQPPKEDEKPPEPAEPVTLVPTRVLLAGAATPYGESFFHPGSSHARVLSNALMQFTQGETGIAIIKSGHKTASRRTIPQPKKGEAIKWKIIHVIGIQALIILVGVIVWLVRWQARATYQMQFRT